MHRNRLTSTERARLAAVGIVLALLCGAVAVAKQPPSAFGSGATNRACTEGRCTTTQVSSNQNPSVVGESVTYTATVSPPTRGIGTPTGTVTFIDGGTTISGCAAQPLSPSGIATCTRSYGSPGVHQISATYNGDGTFTGSTGTLPTQIVDTSGSADGLPTSFSASANPTTAPYGTPITLSATGLPNGASGTVTFADASGYILCTTPQLSSGAASCNTTPTLTPGSYVVTATYTGDSSYQSSTAATSFTIGAGSLLPPPSVSILSPRNGARYPRLQRVLAHYRCVDAAGAPGIARCAATVPTGGAIDTARVGLHKFTAGALSKDGQKAVQTVTYTVTWPNNHFTITRAKTQPAGLISFTLTLPGPGTVDVLETARISAQASAAAVLQPAKHRFVFARGNAKVSQRGSIQLRTTPSPRGLRLLHGLNHKVTIRLWVSYTPYGGRQRNVRRYLTIAP